MPNSVNDSQTSASSDTQRPAVQRHAVQAGVSTLPNVRNTIAIASGKGGVGKSTTAVNLALALAAKGARVGLLDADIYGPSVPLMLGLKGQRPESLDGKTMQPLKAYGLQVMSIGFMVGDDQALIWRGPMATQALDQMLNQCAWDDLDYLLIDLPPGTGDVQLTLAQRVPVTGAVVVTTPQDMSLIDVRKAVAMFEKVSIHMLGVVENMALFCCPNCGHHEPIFGTNGGQAYAAEKGLAYLGAMPLKRSIRENIDQGKPSLIAAPDSEESQLYKALADKVVEQIAQRPKDYTAKMPKVSIVAASGAKPEQA